MAEIQSYSFNATLDTAAASSNNGDINIKEAGRRWKLTSVYFNLFLYYTATGAPIPWITATQQRWLLWNWIGVPSVSGFIEYAGTWANVYNGEKWKLFQPGQYNFQNLYYSDEMLMRFYSFNYDAVNSVNFSVQFVFEIEFIS